MNWDIVKMNTKTGQKIRLTHHLAHDWSPIWTSDGEKIIFIRDSNPPKIRINPQIWIMDKDGKNKRKIAEFKRKKLDYLCLSPDNKEIIFETFEPKKTHRSYTNKRRTYVNIRRYGAYINSACSTRLTNIDKVKIKLRIKKGGE
jgi:Tol biopolymer transport system component